MGGVSGALVFSSGVSSSGASGSISIGTGTAANGEGGDISVNVGTSSTNAGGDLSIRSGQSNAHNGGHVNIRAGEATTSGKSTGNVNIYPGTRGNAGSTSGNVVIYDSESTPSQLLHIDELLVSIGNTQQIDMEAASTVDFTGTSAIVMDGGSVTIKALDQVSGNGGASSVTAGKTTASESDGGDTSVVGGAS